MTHTPGPWQAECASVNGRVVEWFVRRDGDDVSIACDICDPTTESHTISEANARLIAAAPELLACLQLIYPYVRDKRVSTRNARADGTVLNLHIGNAVADAIKKATSR